jgi:hypothetical protein
MGSRIGLERLNRVTASRLLRDSTDFCSIISKIMRQPCDKTDQLDSRAIGVIHGAVYRPLLSLFT